MAHRTKRKPKAPPLTDDEIRRIMLQYFYERNRDATSVRGKESGAAVMISKLRADLKASHSLTAQQVVSNLTYLISQGWVEEKPLAKAFATPRGSVVPAVTPFYIITAAGIDKVVGPSEYTRDRLQGIKIEATGQNIITLGDGNRVDVRYRDIGEGLAELREAVKASPKIEEAKKIELVSDIDSIQNQLAKPEPNKTVVQTLWEGVQKAAVIAGLAEAVVRLAPLIQQVLR